MKKTIMTKWTTALRSGKYTKGRDYLCKGGRFCCLGVLCELYKEENPHEGLKVEFKGKGGHKVKTYGGLEEALPLKVRRWAGITGRTAAFGGFKDKSTALAVLNDGDEFVGIKPHSFKEIAAIIQKKYIQL
jgi:hypothetical protein